MEWGAITKGADMPLDDNEKLLGLIQNRYFNSEPNYRTFLPNDTLADTEGNGSNGNL